MFDDKSMCSLWELQNAQEIVAYRGRFIGYDVRPMTFALVIH